MFTLFYFYSIYHTKGNAMKKMTEKKIREHMLSVDQRRKLVMNGVESVCKGFSTALFVWGPGGLGKSHVLRECLEGMNGAAWRHHTAHSTPKALFLSLLNDPTAVHLYEDCEKVLKTDLSASILRAACGAPDQRERLITYETNHEKLAFNFRGGIIFATNENLSRTNGPMQAVASRFRPIKWDMTLEERIACILTIAKKDHNRNNVFMTAKECTKVALDLVEMCTSSSSHVDLDLRLFCEHALPAYAQNKENPGMKWQDLLQAKLSGIAITQEMTQAERTQSLRQLAVKIDLEGGTTKEKIAKWKELTELGQAIYYRHLREGKAKK